MTSSELEKFTADLDFVLDPFQIRGCEALEEGRGVLGPSRRERHGERGDAGGHAAGGDEADRL